MRRYAQTALLLLLGGMLLKLSFTGSYARYVGRGYLAWLILTGLGLLAIAAVTLVHDIRTLGQPGDDDLTLPMKLGGLFRTVTLSAPDRATTTTGSELSPVPAEPVTSSTLDYRERALAAGLAAAEHEGFAGPEGEAAAEPGPVAAVNAPTAVLGTIPAPAPRAASAELPSPVDPFDDAPPRPAASPLLPGTRGGWALLLAALVVLMVSPPALGTYPAAQLGTVAAKGNPAALPDGDTVALSLVEYAAQAAAGGAGLAGRKVRLVGFVLAGPHGEPYLARLTVGCCAAGARPVKVGLTGDLPGLLTPGAWLAVTGTYSEMVDRDPINAEPIPYLSVVEVTDIDAPADPYER